ncbi:hypothetical protein EDD80_101290 [Anseongella ginsenosidimutans]|uniref:Uncharacterized protein n=1 Tax=Anseongella ginsenosidimutans TaxID=496056 RepID=A0A4R3L112_9SPHI|nr:hypothetical protein EDD80_101290 [Anseongella ginsenosidimutans]
MEREINYKIRNSEIIPEALENPCKIIYFPHQIQYTALQEHNLLFFKRQQPRFCFHQ